MPVLRKNSLIELTTDKNLLENYLNDNFKSASYDLRIGTMFFNGKTITIDNFEIIDDVPSSNPPSNPEPESKKKKRKISLKRKQDFIDLKPSEIVTLLTLEKVNIPNGFCGTVFPINSRSSSGLLILNPGHIDPGFSGYVSICAINLSKDTITLKLQESIFTLLIETLDKDLDGDDLFKPRIFPSRTEYEDYYYGKRFRKMSKSVFDLILSYDSAEWILKLLRITAKVQKWLLRGIGIFILIGSIIAAFAVIFPNSSIFNTNKKVEQLEDSLRSTNNSIRIHKDSLRFKDSIVKERNKLINLMKQDSINRSEKDKTPPLE